MANFSEIIQKLQQKPEKVFPGPDKAAHAVYEGEPDRDAPSTVLVLTDEISRIQGDYAGIVSDHRIEASCPVAVFPAGTDLLAVKMELESVILDEVMFQEAKARLLSVFLEKQNIQALVEEAHAILGLPVTIFDLSTKVVAFAGEEQIKRSAFGPALYVLERGFAMGYVSEREFNEQTRQFAERSGPFVNTFGGGIARLCCRILAMGEFAGHINIMGVDRDFRPSDFAIEELLRDLIEKIWQQENRYFKEPAAALLQNLYDGLFTGGRTELEERFRLLKLITEKEYCVLFLKIPEEASISPPIKSLMKQLVNYSVGEWERKIKFFIRPEGAYSLISIPGKERLPELIQYLERFCQKNDCMGALSKPFHDITEFRLYCDQAQRLADYLDTRKRALATYEAYFWEDLIRCLRQTSELHTFVDSTILELEEYDKINGGQLVKSLCTYLECGYNTSEAAKRLFIHRNTLIRRLDRINQLTGGRYDQVSDACRLILGGKIIEFLER